MGLMSYQDKILAGDQLGRWRQRVREAGRTLVVTNGCFDLLHLGHVTYLETARGLGDVLLVGVNGDQAVRELKGPGRPLNGEDDRAGVLAALECVSAVSVFVEARATHFLRSVRPDVYVKGGDYTLETLDQEERRAVEEGGGRIVLLPLVPGRSTTGLVARLGVGPAEVLPR
jgi:rfaE bifunctional protein nucleotidyltransferase chain/domain